MSYTKSHIRKKGLGGVVFSAWRVAPLWVDNVSAWKIQSEFPALCFQQFSHPESCMLQIYICHKIIDVWVGWYGCRDPAGIQFSSFGLAIHCRHAQPENMSDKEQLHKQSSQTRKFWRGSFACGKQIRSQGLLNTVTCYISIENIQLPLFIHYLSEFIPSVIISCMLI